MTTTKQNLKAGSKRFIDGMKRFGCITLLGIAYVFAALFAVIIWVLTLVFMNPLILWILGFICPKWVIPETKDWCENFHAIGLDLYYDAVKGVFNHLPWYARKHFFLSEGIENADTKDQIRLFKGLPKSERIRFVRDLNFQALEFLWNNNLEMRMVILETLDLSSKLFEKMLYPLDMEAMKAYVGKHPTLRAELVVSLIDKLQEIVRSSEEGCGIIPGIRFVRNLIVSQIEQNGASEAVLEKIGEMHPDVFNQVLKALEVYKERKIVLTASPEQWAEYCKYLSGLNVRLCLKAQVLMNHEQYKVYADSGLSLAESAIISFIKKDDGNENGLVAEIFKRQKIEMSPRMKAYLYANPDVYKLYVHSVVR